MSDTPRPVIRIRDLVVGFGDRLIMNGLNLDVMPGEIMGFVGGSGTGNPCLREPFLG